MNDQGIERFVHLISVAGRPGTVGDPTTGEAIQAWPGSGTQAGDWEYVLYFECPYHPMGGVYHAISDLEDRA